MIALMSVSIFLQTGLFALFGELISWLTSLAGACANPAGIAADDFHDLHEASRSLSLTLTKPLNYTLSS